MSQDEERLRVQAERARALVIKKGMLFTAFQPNLQVATDVIALIRPEGLAIRSLEEIEEMVQSLYPGAVLIKHTLYDGTPKTYDAILFPPKKAEVFTADFLFHHTHNRNTNKL